MVIALAMVWSGCGDPDKEGPGQIGDGGAGVGGGGGNGGGGGSGGEEEELPELTEVWAGRGGPRGRDLIVRVEGTHAREESWAVHASLLDAEGLELKTYPFSIENLPAGPFDETSIQREALDFYPDATRVAVRITKGGLLDDVRIVELEAPPEGALGEGCDTLGIESRCGEGLVCLSGRESESARCEDLQAARLARCQAQPLIVLDWPADQGAFDGSTQLPALWHPPAETLREHRPVMDVPEGAIRLRVSEDIENIAFRTKMVSATASVVSLYEGCGESGIPIASADEQSSIRLPELPAGDYVIVMHETLEGATWELELFRSPNE